MVETWVFGEIRKLLTLSNASTLMSYWRTHGGHEVDFVLERRGVAVGIEVKPGASFHADDRTIAIPFARFFGREGKASARRRCA